MSVLARPMGRLSGRSGDGREGGGRGAVDGRGSGGGGGVRWGAAALGGIVRGVKKDTGSIEKVSKYFCGSEGVKKRHRRQVRAGREAKKNPLERGGPHKKELV